MGCIESREKRLVLIDGQNVAFGYNNAKKGKINKKDDRNFSAEALKNAIEHFENLGHEVKAIIPEFRVHHSSNNNLMREMKDSGQLILVASKAYDDKVLLEAALKNNAAIVTNDRFRDIQEQTSNYNYIIDNLIIRFNWVRDEFIPTEDSYGRCGPSLDDILHI
ncbi:hypothetical protein PVAND_016434 [Polypedilum vanderplanki]|uniref:RNase NYN domain-containing protein n=1 Tax=Polypedilum vanderplanki TaxID=319348 RepID=A0A9J6BFW7_POLVA|nr:hypothetical protein PVAND_016434 [Polypedilum vanderplanki]